MRSVFLFLRVYLPRLQTARKLKLTKVEWTLNKWVARDLRDAALGLFKRQHEEAVDTFPGWKVGDRLLKKDGTPKVAEMTDVDHTDEHADHVDPAPGASGAASTFGLDFVHQLDRFSQVIGRKLEPRHVPSAGDLLKHYSRFTAKHRVHPSAIAEESSDEDDKEELELSSSSGDSVLAAKMAKRNDRRGGAGPSSSSGAGPSTSSGTGPSGSSGSSRGAGGHNRAKEKARSPSPTAPLSPNARAVHGHKLSSDDLRHRKGKGPADAPSLKAGANARGRRRASWNPFSSIVPSGLEGEQAARDGRKGEPAALRKSVGGTPIDTKNKKGRLMGFWGSAKQEEEVDSDSTDEDTRDKLRLAAMRTSIGDHARIDASRHRGGRRSAAPVPALAPLVPLLTTLEDSRLEFYLDKLCLGFQFSQTDLNSKRFFEYYSAQTQAPT